MSFLHRTLEDGSQQIGIGILACDLKLFQQLYPDYSLPEGMVARDYVPGLRHKLIDGRGRVSQGPLPWDQGEQFLARQEYIDGWVHAMEGRIEVPERALVLDRISVPVSDTYHRQFSVEWSDGFRAGRELLKRQGK